MQPVPGAMPGSDTIPSTISERHAADDKLPILAYTFKNLTAEQRRSIYQTLNGKAAHTSSDAALDIELPLSVELRAVPDALAAQIPQTKGYAFVQAGGKVLLVAPANRIVVGEFSP